MRLKARASVPISSGDWRTETRAVKSPAPTRSAAVTSRRMGLTSRLASQSATQIDTARISRETTSRMMLERSSNARERVTSDLKSLTAKIGRASGRERECQYGEIEGCAVSVQKKILKN